MTGTPPRFDYERDEWPDEYAAGFDAGVAEGIRQAHAAAAKAATDGTGYRAADRIIEAINALRPDA